MSATAEKIEVTKEVKVKDFKPTVEVKATTELKNDLLVVSFPEDAYTKNLEANGLSLNETQKVMKFHTEFMKAAIKEVGAELIAGYKDHKDAKGFDCVLDTTLSKIEMYGDKNTTSVVKGTEYHSSGITLKQKLNTPGVKMTLDATKKSIYASFNA